MSGRWVQVIPDDGVSDTPRTDAVDAQCSDYTGDYATMREHASELERALASAEQRIAALQLDAKRYRWLRAQQKWPSQNDPARVTRFDERGDLRFLSGDEMDAAIDAQTAATVDDPL